MERALPCHKMVFHLVLGKCSELVSASGEQYGLIPIGTLLELVVCDQSAVKQALKHIYIKINTGEFLAF